jgi:hypothetical protein
MGWEYWFTNGGASASNEYARFNPSGNLILSSNISTANEITYKLYVNGTSYFNIGTSDNTANKRIVVYGNNRYLSIGASGLQAYTGATDTNTAGLLYL